MVHVRAQVIISIDTQRYLNSHILARCYAQVPSSNFHPHPFIMQSTYMSDTHIGESAVSPAPDHNQGFTITNQDKDILEQYLQEFQVADTTLRTKIIEKAMGELYQLRPVNAPFDKKEASKVCHMCIYPCHIRLIACQKIQKWFYNHYIRPRRQYVKFTRNWSARNAFYHLNRDEVLECTRVDSGAEPGDPAFLGALQDATTILWNKLSFEDQEDYVQAAKEWSADQPPSNIQSR
jgi:hypothetical protein